MSRDHSPTSAVHPDHHLWRNGRLWWTAFTVHRPDWTAERVRRSLGTADLAEARRRRDALLAACATEPGCALSLRFVPTRADRPNLDTEITS